MCALSTPIPAMPELRLLAARLRLACVAPTVLDWHPHAAFVDLIRQISKIR
jgi:hypothetical protein